MVTAAIVPALPPVRRRTAGASGPQRPAARPMPVPALPARHPDDTRYGLAVLDRYGRVADRAVLRALEWGPGQALALSLIAGSVLAVPNPDTSVRVGNDGYLRLPVGLRRACHLTAGDRVLLVADPCAGRLLLHPPATLTALLDAHHTAIHAVHAVAVERATP